MRFKLLAVSSLLLLAASGAFAGGLMVQNEPRAQGIANQSPSFGDDTTGPTNPCGPVQSPDWV